MLNLIVQVTMILTLMFPICCYGYQKSSFSNSYFRVPQNALKFFQNNLNFQSTTKIARKNVPLWSSSHYDGDIQVLNAMVKDWCTEHTFDKDLFLSKRIDIQKRILHLELYQNNWPNKIFSKFPLAIRPKPLAKVGIRTYSSRDRAMSTLIKQLFPEKTSLHGDEKSETNKADEEEEEEESRVSILVYMFVSPTHRRHDIGDMLLSLATAEIEHRKLGQYMLIVHDDKGSGRLINYYIHKGFHPIFDSLDKGMILKLY